MPHDSHPIHPFYVAEGIRVLRLRFGDKCSMNIQVILYNTQPFLASRLTDSPIWKAMFKRLTLYPGI